MQPDECSVELLTTYHTMDGSEYDFVEQRVGHEKTYHINYAPGTAAPARSMMSTIEFDWAVRFWAETVLGS